MIRFAHLTVAALIGFACCAPGRAATMTFFDPSQIATLVAEGTTWDKIRSNGYYFTYTRDKLFTGGGPEPIGRYVRIPWPEGVEAQAVTAGPNPGKAKITIERVDGDIFDFTAFTAKLLANTAGAGGTFEVVPFLNGQEMLPDPVTFDATGYYWSTFSYDTSPNPWGSTAPLTGYDKYTIDLYVDFALIGLTFEGAPIPGPPGDLQQRLRCRCRRLRRVAQDRRHTRRTTTRGERTSARPPALVRQSDRPRSRRCPSQQTIVILLVGMLALSLRRRMLRP